MKKTLFLAAAMMLAMIQAKAQTVMNMTDKQQALVAIAANEAKGDMEALKKEVHNGFEAETVDFNVWPKGVENPYGKFFIGQSYLADMGAVTNVTFEPRCRNNWHVHHKQVQVLICVAGRGWYQEWGKPAVAMTPGTVIAIPAEVKHWHGAAKDSWFQHLTYHKDVQEDASNEWLEPVKEEWYDQLSNETSLSETEK